MTDNQFSAEHAAGNNDVSGERPRWATGVCRQGATGVCRQGAPKACRQGPGKVSCMRRRSSRKRPGTMRLHRNAATRLLTAFVGFALLLGGCRTDSTFEFKADGSVRTQIVFEDDTGSMRTLEQTCEDLREYFGSIGDFAANAKMEDITPPGGHLTCRATSSTPLGSVKLVEAGDTYTLALKPTSETKEDMEGLTAKTTIVMPGKVVKTSIGDIRGNKVVITGVDYLVDGLNITSEKEGSHSPSSNPQSGSFKGKRPSDADNGHGFPPWAWAAGLSGLGLALAGLAIVAARKRRPRNPQANPPGHF